MVNCNPTPTHTNNCAEMLYNNLVSTKGVVAAKAANYTGVCCLQVHVANVPAMTAAQAKIAHYKNTALGWPIIDGTSAYHCNFAADHSANAAIGKIVPWHDP